MSEAGAAAAAAAAQLPMPLHVWAWRFVHDGAAAGRLCGQGGLCMMALLLRGCVGMAWRCVLVLHSHALLFNHPLIPSRLGCSGWLDFIADMQQRVGQLVLLTCPTDRFRPPDRAAAREVIARRNELVRQLVADSWAGRDAASGGSGVENAGHSSGSSSSSAAGGSGGSSAGNGEGSSAGSASVGPTPLLVLDLDALTRQGLPPGAEISPEDHHYQCYLGTSSGYAGGPGRSGGAARRSAAAGRAHAEQVLACRCAVALCSARMLC